MAHPYSRETHRAAARARGGTIREATKEVEEAKRVIKEEEGEWLHELREALRLREWRIAAERRDDMKGIERGIKCEGTRELHAKEA